MGALPTLDAHAHVNPLVKPSDLAESGAVLAQTSSLDDAVLALGRNDENLAWGVGCHPRFPEAQRAFDAERYRSLLVGAAMAGEVGLDSRSKVRLDDQTRVLREILETVAGLHRILSIHSVGVTAEILEELRRTPVAAPILHWWTGTPAETVDAVGMGCFFSIHADVARQSKWWKHVPIDRFLVESDHGRRDPPQAIPLRIGWVEHLVAQQYRVSPLEFRLISWRNLGTIVELTGTRDLLPALFRDTLARL
jgi:TatD DNase family protein